MKPRDPRSLPLLATDPVALAIFEGQQTQHRQPMRPQPGPLPAASCWFWRKTRSQPLITFNTNTPEGMLDILKSAPWRVGDSLYVREAWALIYLEPGEDVEAWDDPAPKKRPEHHWHTVYRAGEDWETNIDDRGFPWRANIHMPEWAARIRTKPLTRVWAERVQDISEEDARAEGIRPLPLQEWQPGCWWTSDVAAGPDLHGRTPVDAYRKMMNSFYPGIWERNDWLWCCAWDGVEVLT